MDHKKITSKNTNISKKSGSFVKASEEQQNVDIHILSSEMELAQHNKSLGTFTLNGIAPAARGVPQIEVIFDIDASGILSVTAKDKSTNQQQSITISGASTLPKDEVERMVKDAETNAIADKKKSNKIETKNKAEVLCYETKKQLEQMSSKITKDEKTTIDFLIKDLEDVLKKEDFAAMKAKIEELTKAMREIKGRTPKEAAEANKVAKEIIDAEFSVEE